MLKISGGRNNLIMKEGALMRGLVKQDNKIARFIFSISLFVLIFITCTTSYAITSYIATTLKGPKTRSSELYYFAPRISNNGDIICLGRVTGVTNNELFFIDATTQATTQLTHDSLSNIVSHSINSNGDVVWEYYDAAYSYEVYLFDKSASTIKKLPSNSPRNRGPVISDNGNVAWVGKGLLSGTEEIYFYDAATSKTTQLTSNSYTDGYPCINNSGDVVWKGSGLMYYDASTATIRTLTSSVYSTSPKISANGNVAWVDYIGDNTNDRNHEIMYYNASTSTITQLTNNSFPEFHLQMNDNGDAVWSSQHSTNSYQNEIFFYDATTSTVTQITSNSTEEYPPQINNSREIVWYAKVISSSTTSTFPIFLYEASTGITTQLTYNYSDQMPYINDDGKIVWSRDSSRLMLGTRSTAVGNQAPSADAGPDKAADIDAYLIFDGSASTDPDGTIEDYFWRFGDGKGRGTRNISAAHIYSTAGTYTATLYATDDQGATGIDTALVVITDDTPNIPPVADAGPDKEALAEDVLSYNGSGSTDPDGRITRYDWDFGDGTNTSGIIADHTYLSAGTYTVTLTVTDERGVTGTNTAIATIYDATYSSLQISPTNDISITSYQGGFRYGKISQYGYDYRIIIENLFGEGAYSAYYTNGSDWLTPVNHQNITLSGTQQGTISLYLARGVNDLAPGTYTDTLEIIHHNGGDDTTITITVTVLPSTFTVIPDSDTMVSGPAGGPFIPSSTTYTVTNTKATPLDIEVYGGDGWITLSSNTLTCVSGGADYICTGTVPIGGTADVTLGNNGNANTLSSGFYFGELYFSDTDPDITWPIGPTASLHWVSLVAVDISGAPGETTTGDNVAIYPEDGSSPGTSNTTTTITFDGVTTAGTTTVNVLPPAPPAPPLPSGIKLGDPPTYYELTTTVEDFQNVTICFDYTGVSYVDESELKLMHFNATSNSWEDITDFLDTESNIICGYTYSLSYFAIVERDSDYTEAGTDVIVEPVDTNPDATIQTPVTITFENVEEAGTTTVTSEPIFLFPPPDGFMVDSIMSYDVESDVVFTGSVEVCFAYGPGDRNSPDDPAEQFYKLFHYEEATTQWVDITTTRDTPGDTICGLTTSFSPFAVFAETEGLNESAMSGGGQSSEVDAFLRYTSPGAKSISLPVGTTDFDIRVGYGDIIADTFQATLNGVPFAGFDSAVTGGWETVSIPLEPGRNVLVLKVKGKKVSGRLATDTDRLVFIVK
jgi:PKD repeat protein